MSLLSILARADTEFHEMSAFRPGAGGGSIKKEPHKQKTFPVVYTISWIPFFKSFFYKLRRQTK